MDFDATTEDSQGTYQSFGFTWKWTGDGKSCGFFFWTRLVGGLALHVKTDSKESAYVWVFFLPIQHHPNSEMEQFFSILLIGKHGTWTLKWKKQVDWNPSCQDGPFGACNLSLQGKHSGLERRNHPFLCENWVCIRIQGPRIHECIDLSINSHSFCQCLFWGHYFWNAHLLFFFLPCFQVSLVLGETTEFFLRRAGDRSMVWDGTHEAQLLLWIHPIMRDC